MTNLLEIDSKKIMRLEESFERIDTKTKSAYAHV